MRQAYQLPLSNVVSPVQNGIVSLANVFDRRAIQSSQVSRRQRIALLGQIRLIEHGGANMPATLSNE